MIASNIRLRVLVIGIEFQLMFKGAFLRVRNYRWRRYFVLLFRCIHRGFSVA